MSHAAETRISAGGLAAAFGDFFRPRAAWFERDIDFASPASRALGRDAASLDHERVARLDLFVRCLMSMALVATLVLSWVRGVTLAMGSAALLVVVAIICASAGVMYRRWRLAPRLAALTTILAEQLAWSALMLVFSYLLIAGEIGRAHV